jgi:hypothetical protein
VRDLGPRQLAVQGVKEQTRSGGHGARTGRPVVTRARSNAPFQRRTNSNVLQHARPHLEYLSDQRWTSESPGASRCGRHVHRAFLSVSMLSLVPPLRPCHEVQRAKEVAGWTGTRTLGSVGALGASNRVVGVPVQVAQSDVCVSTLTPGECRAKKYFQLAAGRSRSTRK